MKPDRPIAYLATAIRDRFARNLCSFTGISTLREEYPNEVRITGNSRLQAGN